MQDISDENLMLLFKEGNAYAFDLLFERHRGPVFNFLYRMLGGDRGSAEDLLQEVFMKVIRGKEFYEPKAKFSTWLFTIARNHCLNLIKSRQYGWTKGTLSVDMGDREATEQWASHGAADVERRETLQLLEQAIGALPHKYREAFILRAVDGFAYQEIATILGLNAATARTHVHRATLMLKDRIGRRLKEEDKLP